MNYEVKKLTRETWLDFVHLFEQDRMTAQCWCLNHRVPVSELVIEGEAKLAMQARICPPKKLRLVTESDVAQNADPAQGLLLYEVDESGAQHAIGWLGLEPLASLVGHDCAQDAQEGEWSIHCIYLLKEQRGQGFSQKLISSAIDMAKSNGARLISAFPCPREQEAGMPESMRFAGRIDSFLAAGFQLKNTISDLYQRVEYQIK